MPPTKKKRTRDSGPSDPSAHLVKATRTDDGGRRGGAAIRDDVGVPASSPASMAPSAAAVRGRAARQRKYLGEMAVLNYQGKS